MTASSEKFSQFRQRRSSERTEEGIEVHDANDGETQKKHGKAMNWAIVWVCVGLALSVGGLLGLQASPLEWSGRSSLVVFLRGPLAVVGLVSLGWTLKCFKPDLKQAVKDGTAMITAFGYEVIILFCTVISVSFFCLASLSEIMATALLVGVITLVFGLNKYWIARIANSL